MTEQHLITCTLLHAPIHKNHVILKIKLNFTLKALDTYEKFLKHEIR